MTSAVLGECCLARSNTTVAILGGWFKTSLAASDSV